MTENLKRRRLNIKLSTRDTFHFYPLLAHQFIFQHCPLTCVRCAENDAYTNVVWYCIVTNAVTLSYVDTEYIGNSGINVYFTAVPVDGKGNRNEIGSQFSKHEPLLF